MLIRYIGQKRPKIVNVAGKDFFFNPTHAFNPIFDKVVIEWLLAKERAGLFVVQEVEDATPSATQPRMTQVAPKQPEFKAETSTVTPKTEEKGQSMVKRGRPKKKR